MAASRSNRRETDPDSVLTREMPHLRIVSDHLWYQANDAVDGRISTDNRTSGSEHPLWNIPRDSRTPLSKILVCGICGERTHVIGNNGYRCRATTKRAVPGTFCWNRASAKCENAQRFPKTGSFFGVPEIWLS